MEFLSLAVVLELDVCKVYFLVLARRHRGSESEKSLTGMLALLVIHAPVGPPKCAPVHKHHHDVSGL
jgi:hypothetical protein